jgi:hypothetical protein
MSVVEIAAFPPAGLLPRLTQARFYSKVVTHQYGCGADQRLRINAPDGAVRVELLGPVTGIDAAPVWQAVRVAKFDRAVWCGPPRGCTDDLLYRFVAQLIELPVHDLAGRWQRLG